MNKPIFKIHTGIEKDKLCVHTTIKVQLPNNKEALIMTVYPEGLQDTFALYNKKIVKNMLIEVLNDVIYSLNDFNK